MIAPHKVYPVEKHGKSYFMVRYKDEAANKWLSKYAPVDKTTIPEVEAWFTTEFNPKQPDVILKKSIANIYPVWEKLPSTINNGNAVNKTGHFNNWILKSPIANIDLEQEQTPKVCIDFIRSIDRAPFTVRNVVQTIREFIDDCRKENLISHKTINLFRDPIVTGEINGGKSVERVAGDENVIALEKEQLQALLASTTVPTDRRARYFLAIGTGMRDAELSGLKVKDIDLTSKEPSVKVERQLRRKVSKEGEWFKAPKKSSFRTLPLHPKVATVLKEWLETHWLAHVGRIPHQDDAVFPNLKGNHYHPNSAIFLRRDLKKSKLSDRFQGVGGKSFAFDFHSLRRSFASLLEIDLGVERARISALLGHKAGGVTAKHYLIKNRAMCSEAISKLPLE